MKSLKEFIYLCIWKDEPIVEMATIGYDLKFGKDRFKVAIHRPSSGDRENPHIHIYLENDKMPFNKFNFEISLTEILCYDEINLIYQRDVRNGIKRTNRNKCSWNGYFKLKEDFEDWLFSKSSKRGDFKDNLDAIIYFYNWESGGTRNSNPLLEYLKRKGMKIQNKFRNYFSEEDTNKYTVCFDK